MAPNGSGAPPRERTRTLTVAVEGGNGPVRFGSAEEWRLLVTLGDRPLARLRLPDPGAGAGEAFFEAAVVAACDDERRRVLLTESLRRRIGGGAEYRHRSVSVVVCTRDRLDTLETLLDALARLDPAPAEVVVVDNAPPEGRDCRALAEAAGAVYVREDVPGLNNARAAGVAASDGELIAFTDDDCVPPPSWLGALDELFDDENIGAVTGPAFPLRLDTPSRVRFEQVSSFDRGLRRRDFDWTVLSPAEATVTGAGANMTLRRSLLERLGDVFPPELDVGTPTRSGGDMYALFKVLAAGRRVTYDPRVFTYHLHRSDPAALHAAIRGYGVGLSAVVTKLLSEEHEPEALKVWRWVARQYVQTVLLGVMGRAGPTDVRIAWDYVRGAIDGPRALREAQRAATATRPPPAVAAPAEPPAPPSRPAASPEVSVVVITHRPREALRHCLAALAAQAGPPFEVVLVDDSPDGMELSPAIPPGLPLRAVSTGGRGAAAARNAGSQAAQGDLLLFLDDDLVPRAGLIERHLARHRDEDPDAIVIGYSPPRPSRSTLAAQAASIWWEDHFRSKREMAAPTFVEMLSGNMSIRRELFDRLGGFDESFGRFRREDWELGVRALEGGARLAYEHDAVADHLFELDAPGRLAAAHAEGRGDALLMERYPFARLSLAVSWSPPPRSLRGRLVFRLVGAERTRPLAVAALGALEAAKLRRRWARAFNLVQRASYARGLREGGARVHDDREASPFAPVELDAVEPLPPPMIVAPALRPVVGGRIAGRDVIPGEGQWNPALGDWLTASVRPPELARARLLSRPAAMSDKLDSVTVLFGPDAPAADARAAAGFARAGAEVRVLQGARHWEQLDLAIRSTTRPFVAFTLPGVAPRPDWLREALVGLEGERVAAVTGAGLRSAPHGRALLLFDGTSSDEPYPVLGLPSQYAVIRRAAYLELGGFDTATARLGTYAPLLDLFERARLAGWRIGLRNTLGLSPPLVAGPARRWAEWRRWQARGALMARDARTRGPLWLLRCAVGPVVLRPLQSLRHGWGIRYAFGSAVALLKGMARGARLG
jgi:GT2 family glycosyltransferase